MATIRLYSFKKRVNSTKRPAVSDTYINLSGEFRAPCSVTQPIVIIEVPAGYDLFTGYYNYAYITDVTRYYFVDDIVMVSSKLAELHLKVDVLATYKVTIGNSTQYVSRTSALMNGNITDNMYPITNSSMIYTDTFSMDWGMLDPGDISDGYYVIGIINNVITAVGAVGYYVLDQVGFAKLRLALLSTVSYSNMNFDEIEEALYKSLFNPFQYMVSCVWFPIKPPTIAIGSGQIYFGFFHVAADSDHMWLLNRTSKQFSDTTLVTYNHPQVSEGTYLQCSPYTKRRILAQPFGEINLDCSKIRGINHVLKLKSWIDFTTGDVTLRVVNTDSTSTDENGAVVGGASAKLGVPLAMAQVSQDVLGAVSGIVQAGTGVVQAGTGIASMASGSVSRGANQLASGVNTMVNGVINAAEAYAPTVSSSGTNGSLLSTIVPCIYEMQFFRITAPDYLHLGAPLCESKQISTLSSNGGFIKCENARIITDVGAYQPEVEAVEAYMNGGFYYE